MRVYVSLCVCVCVCESFLWLWKQVSASSQQSRVLGLAFIQLFLQCRLPEEGMLDPRAWDRAKERKKPTQSQLIKENNKEKKPRASINTELRKHRVLKASSGGRKSVRFEGCGKTVSFCEQYSLP